MQEYKNVWLWSKIRMTIRLLSNILRKNNNNVLNIHSIVERNEFKYGNELCKEIRSTNQYYFKLHEWNKITFFIKNEYNKSWKKESWIFFVSYMVPFLRYFRFLMKVKKRRFRFDTYMFNPKTQNEKVKYFIFFLSSTIFLIFDFWSPKNCKSWKDAFWHTYVQNKTKKWNILFSF